jgi:nucleotide-binding universal stress UspA family protein
MTTAPITAAGFQFRSVLVATDFSEASDKALQYGTAIARRCAASVYLMHAVSSFGLTIAGPEAIAGATVCAERDHKLLEWQLIRSGAIAGLRHRAIVRDGDVWQQLEQAIDEEQIDLVVVGTHARVGLAKLLFGSVAEQIFRNADCPVLTVGPDCPEHCDLDDHSLLGPVLFATNFSEASLAALPYAVSLANQLNTGLGLLHMLSLDTSLPGMSWSRSGDIRNKESDLQRNIKKWLRNLVARSKLKYEPLYLTPFGSLDYELFQVAENLRASAIVLGLHPRSRRGGASHLPGSMAYKIACQLPCPVLTFRGPYHGENVGCRRSNPLRIPQRSDMGLVSG